MLKNNKISMILYCYTLLFSASIEQSFANNLTNNAEMEAEKTSLSGSYLASRFSRSEGDVERATKDLLAVYRQNPNDAEIASQLMGLYLLAGNVDKAMMVAEKILETNGKDQISALMLSLRAIKNNNFEMATELLNPLLAEDGGQLWLPLIAGWLDAQNHKLKTPLTMEELSAEVGRAAPLVSYHLALINTKAGFIEAATENFKQAVSENTENPPARIMQMLTQFYAQNNSPEALKSIANDYLTKNPYAQNNKIEFISSVPDGVAEVLYNIGAIMLASDVAQEATIYLQLAIYMRPDLENATLTLADAYRDLNQYALADELLSKIPKTSALYSTAQLYSALNLAALKEYDHATAKLNQLIASEPNNLLPYMAKGEMLRDQNKFSEAVKIYEEAISNTKDGKNWQIFFALAACYDQLGKWEIAEKNLRLAIEASPNQPDVLNYLGYSLLLQVEKSGNEKLPEAKAYIAKAISIRPEDPQIMDSMGWALYLAGDYENAAIYLEGAVSLLPADATVNEHLGDVYYRLGRKTEAKFQWERVLIYSKDEAVLETIRKKLKGGLPEATAENTLKPIKSVSIE